MDKKFFIAWLVMFILYMAAGFVVHGTLLKEDYMGLPSLFRSQEESMPYFHLMIIAHVLMAGAFTWIYARGVENKPWLGQGLRFGLAVALLAVVPLYMIYFVVQPMPGELVIKQIVSDTIMSLILGSVVAFLYRGQGRA
ncbi:MAG TPA: hypothetical protein VGA24_00665 [Steroidobacteraceae bacterium]